MEGDSTSILFTEVTLLHDFIMLLRIRFFPSENVQNEHLFMMLKAAFYYLSIYREMGDFNPKKT